jgi:hypothetical protein
MANPTPYRTLTRERRIELVTRMIDSGREGRALLVQRLASKTGFRPATLQSWPADKLAREIVRTRAETPQDELSLLHLLYVEVDPSIQITFLDAAGVSHDNGVMPDDLESPYANMDGVKRGIDAVRAIHGEDGERYLRTLSRYSADGWPGISDTTAE